MANFLPRERQVAVLHHLVEGNTLRSTSRLSGVHRTTVTNLMVRFGEGCRLTVDEKAERSDVGDVYLWTCFDQRTKLVAAYIIGNLTIRTLMKRFTRLSVGFSKCIENHEAAIAGFLGYYNSVWRTRYPDYSGKPGKLSPPAAMMAGINDHLWTFNELFDAAMAA